VEGDRDLLAACSYVDANPADGRDSVAPRPGDWCGFAATLGLAHARPFHDPSALLELLHPSPAAARVTYAELVQSEHDRRRRDRSPNEVTAA
jgi:hypothetical protein